MSGENPDAQRGDIASRTNLGGALSDLVIATRNVKDYRGLGVRWLDPFEPSAR
jgi:hypothetical protein